MKTRNTFVFWAFATFLLFEFTFLIRTLSLTHPIMMIGLVTIFTAFTCNSWRTAAVCILGIVVYVAVTFVCKAWRPTTLNLFATNVIYSTGVGIWAYGIYQAFQNTWDEKSRNRHLS